MLHFWVLINSLISDVHAHLSNFNFKVLIFL